MILPEISPKKKFIHIVAEKTLHCLKNSVPKEVPK